MPRRAVHGPSGLPSQNAWRVQCPIVSLAPLVLHNFISLYGMAAGSISFLYVKASISIELKKRESRYATGRAR